LELDEKSRALLEALSKLEHAELKVAQEARKRLDAERLLRRMDNGVISEVGRIVDQQRAAPPRRLYATSHEPLQTSTSERHRARNNSTDIDTATVGEFGRSSRPLQQQYQYAEEDKGDETQDRYVHTAIKGTMDINDDERPGSDGDLRGRMVLSEVDEIGDVDDDTPCDEARKEKASVRPQLRPSFDSVRRQGSGNINNNSSTVRENRRASGSAEWAASTSRRIEEAMAQRGWNARVNR